MRHAALGGGKRLRPFLVVESAALFGATGEGPLLAGCALECLHCYSLVHDDLPSMDNDDLRRGRPTVHKAYDEATAILVGDALLTLAFDILARDRSARGRQCAHRTGARARPRRRHRRHGRRADARPRCRRPLRGQARADRERDHHVAGDEDRRAVALRLPRRRHPRPGGRRVARRNRPLRRHRRPGVPDRRRSARRRRRHRDAWARRPARTPPPARARS